MIIKHQRKFRARHGFIECCDKCRREIDEDEVRFARMGKYKVQSMAFIGPPFKHIPYEHAIEETVLCGDCVRRREVVRSDRHCIY